MKRKLTLILLPACLAATVGLHAASAGADSGAGATEPSNATSEATLPACSNGSDDDGDGKIDMEDPGCSSPSDESESPDPAKPVEAGTAIVPEAGAEDNDREAGGEGAQQGETIGEGREAGAGARHNQQIGAGSGSLDGGLQAPSSKSSEASSRRRRHSGGTSANSAQSSGSSTSSESSISSSSLLTGASEFTVGSAAVPALLLPVYEACGSQYGIPWEVLAAINKVETNFGSDLGNSSSGAEGWMQFLPSSWAAWGVDGNGDGRKDPADPVDAICAAARYLKASGGAEHIYRAVFAYNHADWYVQKVLTLAREYESLPENLIASLTSLAEGSTFPVEGGGSYSDEAGARALLQGTWLSEAVEPESSEESEGVEAGTKIYASRGSPVVAVASGVVRAVGRSEALGRYLVLEDAFGDRFVYSNLATARSGEGVRKGTHVSAGATLARVGSSGGAYIGFSIHPSGSAQIDPVTMLDAWKRGGVGKIYRVAAKHALAADVSPARVLLMSSGELRRRILSDARLTLPTCESNAIASGRVDRRTMAALEYMTSAGYELAIARSTCARRVGFTLDVAAIDGTAVRGHQGAAAKVKALLRRANGLKGGLGAQRLVSTTSSAAAGEAVISSDGDSGVASLDFYPPQKATLVNGRATAPVDAPAAVQAMIAAANQISTTPYVWGGGHGSWVSSGYDCSGSVSYVLHAAQLLSTPLTSGALESWGSSGSGRWVTVYANATHTYAVIAGLRWDTVGDASGSGPRWHDAPAYPEGFAVRHPDGY